MEKTQAEGLKNSVPQSLRFLILETKMKNIELVNVLYDSMYL